MFVRSDRTVRREGWGGKPAGIGIGALEKKIIILVLSEVLACSGEGGWVSISSHWIKAFRMVRTFVRSCGLGSISYPLLGLDWPHSHFAGSGHAGEGEGFSEQWRGVGLGGGGVTGAREREREYLNHMHASFIVIACSSENR